MKNKLIKNVKNQLVTWFKKSTDTGNGFVRLPGKHTVSIVSLPKVILVKNSVLIFGKTLRRVKEGNASCNNSFFPNFWGTMLHHALFLEKFIFVRQQPIVNKTTNNFKRKRFCESLIFNISTYVLLTKVTKLGLRGLNLILLMSGDVERNPGPGLVRKDDTKQRLTIITYNVRGLKEYTKLKRVLNKCATLLKSNQNTVICLQETHLERGDENKIKIMWRESFSSSPGGNKSRGCLTLFSSSWEVVNTLCDPEGRLNIVTIKKNFGTFTIANVYAPNEHNVSFFERVIEKVVNIKDDIDSTPIILGDFNLVVNDKLDSLNRQTSINEGITSTFITNSFSALGLVDSYRQLYESGGYTWQRGKCYSRLDMIYTHESLKNKIKYATLDWYFDKSDHASLRLDLDLNDVRVRGRGLPKVDSSILNDQSIRAEIISQIKETIETIPEDWDPNKAWEFIKIAVRSIMWEFKGRIKKIENKEIEASKEQLRILKESKEKLCKNNSVDLRLLRDIDSAITSIEVELYNEWEKQSKDLAFRAKVKWFNEGEKSNKYFLNIIKKRQAETLITNLSWGDRVAESQESIQNLVVDFYEDLYSERKDLIEEYDSFFSPDTPKLSDDDRRMLDKPITLEEITDTLRSCEESAAGPDRLTYKTYMQLWEVLGPISLNSWNYSNEINSLPDSQKTSTITLLPKEGKDLSQIGNWRPITLTNCDLKIYTKCMANRVSKVLDKVIFRSQTAYIPGRNVHNNSRMFDFYRNYCKNHNVDAVLMSLDAKKAFDSVDHKYMTTVLEKYGFSKQFIDTVKLLYNDIKADILVNGYRTVAIKIGRCVKQGDALSCALFILCLDPLIRNIENNKKIKEIEIKTSMSNKVIRAKTGAFADDVGTLSMGDPTSINEIFSEYKRFSIRSGIELNETKTEILQLNKKRPNSGFSPVLFNISVPGVVFEVKSVQSVKICGITHSNCPTISYQQNVVDKINKLKKKLLAWQFRGLSLGGKILVINTFGISQLIYTMQVCEYFDSDLKEIENFIFGFIWSKNLNIVKAPDRIKREIMKQDYDNGGLRVPDLWAINSALKLRQFFQASSSNHIIKSIQEYVMEDLNYDYVINQEYSRVSNIDNVIRVSQLTINFLTNKWRNEVTLSTSSSSVIVDLISSTDVKEYLKLKKEYLMLSLYARLFRSGIENFKQLVMEKRFPRSESFAQLSSTIIGVFPKVWEQLILSNIEANSEIDVRLNIVIDKETVKPGKACTVKDIRKRLVRTDVITPKYITSLGITPHDGINPFVTARKANHATAQKIFKFRLLHMDIFTKQRMFKFKMIESEVCDICNEVETLRHAIWDCRRAKAVWQSFNCMLQSLAVQVNVSFENIFIGFSPPNFVLESITTRLTQYLLSYDRTKQITQQNVKNLLRNYALLNKRINISKRLKEHEIVWENIIQWCEY